MWHDSLLEISQFAFEFSFRLITKRKLFVDISESSSKLINEQLKGQLGVMKIKSFEVNLKRHVINFEVILKNKLNCESLLIVDWNFIIT